MFVRFIPSTITLASDVLGITHNSKTAFRRHMFGFFFILVCIHTDTFYNKTILSDCVMIWLTHILGVYRSNSPKWWPIDINKSSIGRNEKHQRYLCTIKNLVTLNNLCKLENTLLNFSGKTVYPAIEYLKVGKLHIICLVLSKKNRICYYTVVLLQHLMCGGWYIALTASYY